jgi:hypothetical protein
MEIPQLPAITSYHIQVRQPEGRSDSILGFAELHLIGDNAIVIYKIKGFVIRKKKFGDNNVEVTTVDFPAFSSKRSKSGYQTSFIVESKELYRDICQQILQEYGLVSGRVVAEENVDPSEIPF